jgi:hypothetical protein
MIGVAEMPTSILTCPHCGASLAASRFAATTVCRYCNATVRIDPSFVSARAYREAWHEWNDAPGGQPSERFSIGDAHWTALRLLAHGEVSDVYLAQRARWPSELVVFKVLRDDGDAPLLEQEFRVLEQLQNSDAAAGMDLARRIPFPIATGTLSGSRAGRRGAAYRWIGGFTHTFEMVRAAHAEGIEPAAAIWVWRRILEILGVMHRAGFAHGAVLPNHLLVERGEHGVRLVGFGCADKPGAPLRVVSTRFEDFYPQLETVSAEADVIMSARCVAYLLGRDVPAPLAELLQHPDEDDPWALHGRLGELGKELFGPPSFHPIELGGV